MARLISDKYKEWKAECEARFLQLKKNEEKWLCVNSWGRAKIKKTEVMRE